MRRSKPNVNDHARPRGRPKANFAELLSFQNDTRPAAGSRGPRCTYRSFGNRERRAPAAGSSELAHLASDLPDGLLLKLTDALARQVVLVADLLQRELVFVIET